MVVKTCIGNINSAYTAVTSRVAEPTSTPPIKKFIVRTACAPETLRRIQNS